MIVMIPLALIRTEVVDPIATIIDVVLRLFLIRLFLVVMVLVLLAITITITDILPMAKIDPLKRTQTQLKIYLTALIPTVTSFKNVTPQLRSSRS
jgi:hypothetical protein